MKRLFVFIIVAMSMSACFGSSSQPAYNCGEGICTQLQVIDSVRTNQPTTIVITVTADKDVPGLGVSLYYDANVDIDGPQGWEDNAKDANVWKGGASWSAGAKARQPLRFTRRIRLPSKEGLFTLAASASIPSKGPVATDSVVIYLTASGGTVYPSGTTIPITPGPVPTIRPGPSPTFVPTPTRKPYP